MDYEKKYKEALEWAGKVMQGKVGFVLDEMLEKFPELKESGDEKIRKAIIEFFELQEDNTTYSLVPKKDIITWLEKQGEQKGTLCDTCRKAQPSHSCQDITALGRCALEKQGEQKPADKEYTFKAIPRLLGMTPPTDRAKSYCQKLIDSLEQEGYSTDAKIVRDCLKQMNGEKVAMATMDEQKPAWSEEDEAHIMAIDLAVNKCLGKWQCCGEKCPIYEHNPWLKSLKDRVQPQPKQKWSEEDERLREYCINAINGIHYYSPENKQELVGWLKSLRPQNWTKEDKERYISCLQRLGTGNPEQPETINSKWFKEHVYPQKQWKPSATDIIVLENVIDRGRNPIDYQATLHGILEQLKKLRGNSYEE